MKSFNYLKHWFLGVFGEKNPYFESNSIKYSCPHCGITSWLGWSQYKTALLRDELLHDNNNTHRVLTLFKELKEDRDEAWKYVREFRTSIDALRDELAKSRVKNSIDSKIV